MGVEHHHALPRQVEMSFIVQRHPVGALLDDERLAEQVPIGCDMVPEGSCRTPLCRFRRVAVRAQQFQSRSMQVVGGEIRSEIGAVAVAASA